MTAPGAGPPAAARVTLGDTGVDVEPVPDYGQLSRLDDRAFVVFGAGRGIGRQVSHALAQMGARVACVDREREYADAVASEIGGVGLVADITQREEVERVLAEVGEQVGPVRGLVDIVGLGHRGPLTTVDDATWRWQFEVVVDHAFLAVQVGGRVIAEAGGGSMVFVGSIAGLVTTGYYHPAYGAAKAALHHLVRYAGKELGPSNVRVNGVAPGVTLTTRARTHWSEEQVDRLDALIPRGGPGEAWEIAAPIVFLATDASSFITGQVIAVDGGLAGTLRLDLI